MAEINQRRKAVLVKIYDKTTRKKARKMGESACPKQVGEIPL